MNDPRISVTEDELHAYVDGELPEERRADVEAWLKSHPDDAARVRSWLAMADVLRARFDPVIDEAVPKRLRIDVLLRQRPDRWRMTLVAATLVAFIAGGAIGWFGHGAAGTRPSTFVSFTDDALDAHKLYAVEVRHPVEVAADERTHLLQWLSKRCGYDVMAPQLDASGLKLVGGRLLPGPSGPASFLMYENASGERFTIYASRAKGDAQMRYASSNGTGALFWADRGVGYVVAGPTDREHLTEVARSVYDQTDRKGG